MSAARDKVLNCEPATIVQFGGGGRAAKLLIWLAAIVGIASLFFLYRQGSSVARKEALVELEIPADSLNVGEVWEAEEFKWSMPIKNKGEAPIEIAWFSKSCTCVGIEPESFILGAGESREMRLKIDLTSTPVSDSRDFAIWLSPRLKIGSDGVAAIGPE